MKRVCTCTSVSLARSLWFVHGVVMDAYSHTYILHSGRGEGEGEGEGQQYPFTQTHTHTHTHTQSLTHPHYYPNTVSPIRKNDETGLESELLRRAAERAERGAHEILV